MQETREKPLSNDRSSWDVEIPFTIHILSYSFAAQKKHRQSPSRYIFHFHFTLYFRELLLYKKIASDEIFSSSNNIQKEWFNINKWFLVYGMRYIALFG